MYVCPQKIWYSFWSTPCQQHFGCDWWRKKLSSRKLTWQWNVLHWLSNYNLGYGSIPINSIFRGMNIHLPAILWCSPGVQGFDTLPSIFSRMYDWDEKFESRTASNPKRFQSKTCRAAISSHIQRQLRGLVFLHQQPAEWGYGNAVICGNTG